MASSGNFGTWNFLNIGSGGATSLTVGNTNAVMTGADPRTTGTVGGVISDTDGYYFETVATSIGDGALTLGIVNEDRNNQCMGGQIHSRSGSFMWRPYSSGQFFVETSTNTSYGTFANGDILGWYVKNSKLYVKKNNSNVVGDVANVSAGIDISGGFFFPAVSRTVGGGSQTTAILRTDSDDWSYSPPAGFKGLTSKDMLVDSNIDPAGDDGADDNPTKQFNTVIWTGNQSTQAITGVGFKPDLVWLKQRAGSGNPNILTDSSRGVTKRLESNADIAEGTDSDGLTAFGTDGFTLGSNDKYNYGSGWTYVGWSWKANGGTTTSFSSGGNQLAGTYQANTKSKFSIITYTGSGSTGEVLHGMSATPNFIIAKDRGATYWWNVYHKSGGTVNTGYDSLLYLNSNNAVASGQNVNIVPDSTKISMAGNEQINKSGNTYVMYAWADVEGMQKFGKYEGNGNSDGPFIYLGFRPRMMCIKSMDSNQAWIVCDTARETFNPLGEKVLQWNTNDQEYDPSGFNWDALSNGFKIRSSDTNINATQTYIYMAWGDVPFKYNNTF
tara:strand:- start:3 stop:1667 length:1665 start_codon:yes stop_codon:yes gene_type:complete